MDLLTHLRDHLIAEGLVRRPSVAGAAPPMWLEPRDGVPAPGEGENATEIGPTTVVGAYLTGGIPPRPYMAMLRRDTVDVWLRSQRAPLNFQLEVAIRTAVIDRRDWTMAGLQVVESLMWRPLQRLESGPQGYTHIFSLIFETYSP
jgi:hypothetical protein